MLAPELSSFSSFLGMFLYLILLPLDALAFKLKIGFTLVELPEELCAKISFAKSSLALIELPLDEDVSAFKALPLP